MDYSNLTKEELIEKHQLLLKKYNNLQNMTTPDVSCLRNFTFFVEILNSAALVTDNQGNIIEINSIMLEILGLSSKSAAKKINILTYPPLVKSGYSEKVRQCLDSGEAKQGEQHYTTKWGKVLSVRYDMFAVKEGDTFVGVFINYKDATKELFLSFSTDISDRLKQEDELNRAKELAEESEKKLRSIFDLVPTGIVIIKDHVVIDVNDRVCLETGILKEDLLGKSPESLYFSPEEYALGSTESYRQIREKGKGNLEIGFKSKTGERINSLLTSVPIIFSDNVEGYVFSAFDITEQKRNEAALREAKAKAEESDHLKSAFLANMSHEIRTPMNGILGFSELLELPDLTIEERKQYVEIIHKSGIRMLNILDDLIDISKIEAGQMELTLSEVNIPELIKDIFSFFEPEARNKGLELDCQIRLDFGERFVETDRVKIEALLTNLVKNAIKYSRIGKIEIGCRCQKDRLEFSVKDQGIGIAADQLNDVFIRFVQNEIPSTMVREGAGLGLAIAKGYIDMLGGNIWVESVLGEGSVFYFSIPVVKC